MSYAAIETICAEQRKAFYRERGRLLSYGHGLRVCYVGDKGGWVALTREERALERAADAILAAGKVGA